MQAVTVTRTGYLTGLTVSMPCGPIRRNVQVRTNFYALGIGDVLDASSSAICGGTCAVSPSTDCIPVTITYSRLPPRISFSILRMAHASE